jgi:transposase InsO family protein
VRHDRLKQAVVSDRLMIVTAAQMEGVSAASRKFDCSRTTIYALMARYRAQGLEGLLNRPRGPKAPIPEEIEEAIICFKLDLLSRSTSKIQTLVQQIYGCSISRQTVWRVLSARGLARITEPVSLVRFARPSPNDLWQFDVMEDEHTAIGKVHLPVAVDDASRFCVAGRFVRSKAQPAVLGVLAEALRTYGLPSEILTDRAVMFYGPSTAHQGLTVYQVAMQMLGIRAGFAKPYKARTKGKVEKFIQFVQKDFLGEVKDRVRSLDDLNGRWERWKAWYNQERAHSSLGQGPPARLYRNSRRQAPAELERLLSVQEPRRVGRDASISVAGRRYALPAEYMGRHVWVAMLNDQLCIEHGGRTIATYTR